MRLTTSRLLAGVLLVALPACVTAAEPAAAEGIRIRGYGEMLYSRYDFGPDARSGPNGAPADSRAELDLERLVLELTYTFEPGLDFEVEVEFEHGGTGATMELEYEEFGEYEMEVEKGGEVAIEQLHITKVFSPLVSLRLGHFVLPVGQANLGHLPHQYFGTTRPEGENTLIPVVWHETGVEAFGTLKDWNYRLQLVNGLNSTGFSSRNWVRGGHQGRFEKVDATDLAVVARLEYRGVEGLVVGGSVYHGDTSGNRPKPDMEDTSARLTIVAADARYMKGPLRARASLLAGDLENAQEISAKNSRLSTNLGVPRTPVAEGAQAWGVELGYDILPLLRPGARGGLLPFLRYEHYNAMASVPAGMYDDPRFERTVMTAGLNWELHPRVVLKVDGSVRSFGLERYREERTLGVGLGWRMG